MRDAACDDLHETVVAFYSDGTREWDRLEHGRGLLELRRTQELLQRLLPAAPATVLDVGGGPGRYAAWMAELGHAVTLIEPVPALVEQARTRADTGAHPFAVVTGDARSLDVEAQTAHAVVLMGPLYHLPDASDRARALAEAFRVLAPGGVVVAGGICRYAAILDAARVGSLSEELVTRAQTSFLADGRFVAGNDGFTRAYFHRPDELADELETAGFTDVRTYGVEGPLWPILPGAGQAARTAERPPELDSVIRCARMTETDPTIVGASSHLLTAGRRSD